MIESQAWTNTLDVREGIASTAVIPARRDHYLADVTLALAAEAFQESGTSGRAIVCDESGDRFCVMSAVHCHDRTELQTWSSRDPETAAEYVESLLRAAPEARFMLESQDIIAENAPLLLLTGDGRFAPVEGPTVSGVLSGSFNPLHAAHRRMLATAEQLLGRPVVFEMSLKNAEKRPLDWLSLRLRSQQFSAGELLLTRVPTFVEKAELLPQTTFVVGWDTAARVLERRFYPHGELESALETIAERECRFLVAARRDERGLRTLDELMIPGRYRDLFSAIPPELFEEEISSTAIRESWLRGESETGPPSLFSSGMNDF